MQEKEAHNVEAQEEGEYEEEVIKDKELKEVSITGLMSRINTVVLRGWNRKRKRRGKIYRIPLDSWLFLARLK